MSSSNYKEITDKDREQINILVGSLGGINSAANILGIGKGTLGGYLDGTKPRMTKGRWKELFSKSCESILVEVGKELKELRKLPSKLRNSEFEVRFQKIGFEQDMEKFRKEVKKIIDSPFSTYFKLFSITDGFYDFPILGDVRLLKGGDDPLLTNLAVHLNELVQIYELFRPEKITSGGNYFGTVKKMTVIFTTFACLYGGEFGRSFTNPNFRSMEDTTPVKKSKEDIDWEYLLTDLEFIVSEINKVVALRAVECFHLCEDNYWFYSAFGSFLKLYLERFDRILQYDDFKFSFSRMKGVGELDIDGSIITFSSKHELDRGLYAIS